MSIYQSPLTHGQFETSKKLKEQLGTLTNKVTIFNEDVGMEFGISKCGAIMKKGKLSNSDRTELPSGETIHEVDQKKQNNYLGILESDGIMLEIIYFRIPKKNYKDPQVPPKW